ncbi:hypothetical protein D3C86_2125840 [compost metagenome]
MRGQIVHLARERIGVEHVRVPGVHPDAVVVEHGNRDPVLLGFSWRGEARQEEAREQHSCAACSYAFT